MINVHDKGNHSTNKLFILFSIHSSGRNTIELCAFTTCSIRKQASSKMYNWVWEVTANLTEKPCTREEKNT